MVVEDKKAVAKRWSQQAKLHVEGNLTAAEIDNLMPGLIRPDYDTYYADNKTFNALYQYLTVNRRRHIGRLETRRFYGVIRDLLPKKACFRVKELEEFRRKVKQKFPNNQYIQREASGILVDIGRYQEEKLVISVVG